MKNNKQKLNLFAFTFLLFAANMSAQVVQKIGDNSFTIDTNSVVETLRTIVARADACNKDFNLATTGTATAMFETSETAGSPSPKLRLRYFLDIRRKFAESQQCAPEAPLLMLHSPCQYQQYKQQRKQNKQLTNTSR